MMDAVRTLRFAVCLATALFLVACSDGASDTSTTAAGQVTTTAAQVIPVTDEAVVASTWDSRGIRLTSLDGTISEDILADLPAGVDRLGEPDWSPDGDRLVVNVVTNDGSPGSILITNLAGDDQRVAESCDLPCLGYGAPSWSRDGARIVYPRADGSGMTVRVFDVQLGTESDLLRVSEPRRAIDMLRWSPSGDTLVGIDQQFNSVDDSKVDSAALVVVAADGSLSDIVGAPEFASYPDWHPTEDLIVFATYGLSEFQSLEEQASNLYTIRPDGSALTQITDFPAGGPRATQPTWSPDGRLIVFTLVTGDNDNIRHIATVAADGTGLIDTGAPGTHNRLRPST